MNRRPIPPALGDQLEAIRPAGEGWTARCPAHPDRNPSLSVTPHPDGKVLIHCHTGCTPDAILQAVGLTWTDLSPIDRDDERETWTPHGPAVAVYPYTDETRNLLFEVCRTADKSFPQRRPDPSRKSGWTWSLGDVRRVPYRLPQLIEGVAEGRHIFVCEGEKDVHALLEHGQVATCNPGGAGKWRLEYVEHFRDAYVTVCADADDPGRAHARAVSASLAGTARKVRIVEAQPPHKDVAAHLGAGLDLSGDLLITQPEGSHTAQTEGPTPASWAPIDLGPYLDGTHEPCVPTLLRRTDGPHLLYPGRVHWLAGEPEALKSWLALLACVQVLDDDGRVMFIDFEDGPAGIVGRLLALGADPQVIAARFDYRSPDGALRHAERDGLAGDVAAADLLVIDACTEALAAQGLSSKDDTDVASWLALLPRWAARLGPAVLVLDHVVKDSESRGRWATGSQHKLAGLDGVALTLESVQPGGVGMVGRSRLYVSKDRHGQVRPHSVPSTGGKAWLADLVVDSSGPFVEAVLHPPTTQEGPFRPTYLMTRVSAVLAKAVEPLAGREIEDRVTGKAANVRQAVAALMDDGHIEVTRGKNNAKLHRLLRPFPTPEEDQ